LPLDYIVASPIFATPTKNDTAKPWGLEGLTKLKKAAKAPLLAIGGIHTHNAKAVMQAGAQGLCIISAIMHSQNPRQCASELKAIASS
ncbi:MAG TPA: thiamine phosphate synthase, partial [Opitutales bacterium]|nr:thiamine phosphate synthase [Opitutales bacterium]